MERLTVKWTDKVYDTLDPVDILDNEYSKTNYNKLLTKLGEYEDFEEIFREKMTDTACEFLKDKEEFSKWLDRTEWIVRKCDEYARAEEQGLLLKLPCKVGTVAYLIDHNFVRMERKPIKCIIDEFTVDRYNDCYAVLNGAENFYMMRRFRAINIKQFGETIFLTKEEAEKALERLEKDNE